VWACPQQDYSLVRRGTVTIYRFCSQRRPLGDSAQTALPCGATALAGNHRKRCTMAAKNARPAGWAPPLPAGACGPYAPVLHLLRCGLLPRSSAAGTSASPRPAHRAGGCTFLRRSPVQLARDTRTRARVLTPDSRARPPVLRLPQAPRPQRRWSSPAAQHPTTSTLPSTMSTCRSPTAGASGHSTPTGSRASRWTPRSRR